MNPFDGMVNKESVEDRKKRERQKEFELMTRIYEEQSPMVTRVLHQFGATLKPGPSGEDYEIIIHKPELDTRTNTNTITAYWKFRMYPNKSIAYLLVSLKRTSHGYMGFLVSITGVYTRGDTMADLNEKSLISTIKEIYKKAQPS